MLTVFGRICHLLQQWVRRYPDDFATVTQSTQSALLAFTHFVDYCTEESDEPPAISGHFCPKSPQSQRTSSFTAATASLRMPRQDLPLSNGNQSLLPAKIVLATDKATYKANLKSLARNSKAIACIDSVHIAEEITRIQAEYFLEIEVSCACLTELPV